LGYLWYIWILVIGGILMIAGGSIVPNNDLISNGWEILKLGTFLFFITLLVWVYANLD
jgi:hypothetical protein